MRRWEVEAAVEWVLGEEVNRAMAQSGCALPERLKEAAVKAFREDWPDELHLERIRSALNMLQAPGYFTFEE